MTKQLDEKNQELTRQTASLEEMQKKLESQKKGGRGAKGKKKR
jgi:hypothetical protein